MGAAASAGAPVVEFPEKLDKEMCEKFVGEASWDIRKYNDVRRPHSPPPPIPP